MTEKEARTKWCPMARYTSVRGTAINRWVDPEDGVQLSPEPARCLASSCAAWRFEPVMAMITPVNSTRPPFVGPAADYEGNQSGWGVKRHTPTGYCGLAGAPK